MRRLGSRWGRELARVRFAVEEVPGVEPWFDGPVPLGQTVAGEGDRQVQITVFRRPVEARAGDEPELARLIRDLLVEEVADLLGLSPESVDPSYDSPDD